MQKEQTVCPSYFGDPEAAARPVGEGLPPPALIEMKYQIYNHTGSDITVVSRMGIPSTMKQDYRPAFRNVLIRVELVFSAQLRESLDSILERASDTAIGNLAIFKAARDAGRHNKWASGASLMLDFKVSEETLREHGGTIYHHETDLIITFCDVDEAPLHPYSREGIRKNNLKHNPFVRDDGSFGYHIEIVDNAGLYGKFYINLNNEIWDIKPTKSNLKKDGIYVTSNHKSVGGRQMPGKLLSEHPLTIEAAQELGLFTSYSDALTMGDHSGVRKKELLDLEHSNKLLSADLIRQKQEHESWMQRNEAMLSEKERAYKEQDLAREARIRELEEAQNRLEHQMAMEKLTLKDLYDQKANTRKDTGEILKLIVPVATGIVAIIGLTRPLWKKS